MQFEYYKNSMSENVCVKYYDAHIMSALKRRGKVRNANVTST